MQKSCRKLHHMRNKYLQAFKCGLSWHYLNYWKRQKNPTSKYNLFVLLLPQRKRPYSHQETSKHAELEQPNSISYFMGFLCLKLRPPQATPLLQENVLSTVPSVHSASPKQRLISQDSYFPLFVVIQKLRFWEGKTNGHVAKSREEKFRLCLRINNPLYS